MSSMNLHRVVLLAMCFVLVSAAVAAYPETQIDTNTTNLICPHYYNIHMQREKYQEIGLLGVSGGTGEIKYDFKNPIDFYYEGSSLDTKYHLELVTVNDDQLTDGPGSFSIRGYPTDFSINGTKVDNTWIYIVATDTSGNSVECQGSIFLRDGSTRFGSAQLPSFPSYHFLMTSEYSEISLPRPFGGIPPYSYSLDFPLPSGLVLNSTKGTIEGGFNCLEAELHEGHPNRANSIENKYFLRNLTIKDSSGNGSTYPFLLVRSNSKTIQTSSRIFKEDSRNHIPSPYSGLDSIPILTPILSDHITMRENEAVSINLPRARYGDGELIYYGDLYRFFSAPGISIDDGRLIGIPGNRGIGDHYLQWRVVDENHDTDVMTIKLRIEEDTYPQFNRINQVHRYQDLDPLGYSVLPQRSIPSYRIWDVDYTNLPILEDISITLPWATEGNGILDYSLNPELPDGLQLVGNNITGSVTEEIAPQYYTWKVVDEDHDMDWISFSLGFASPNSSPWASISRNLAFQPPLLFYPYAKGVFWLTRGDNFNHKIIVNGGDDGYLQYSIYPELPSGLDLIGNRILGTPTESSLPTEYVITVTNSIGDSSSQTISIAIDDEVVNIPRFSKDTWNINVQVGEMADESLPMAVGGDLNLNYELEYQILPKVPDGLGIECHRLRGVPINPEDSGVYTLRVSDYNGDTDEIELNIAINQPDLLTSTTTTLISIVPDTGRSEDLDNSRELTDDSLSSSIEHVRWEVGSRVDHHFGTATGIDSRGHTFNLFGQLPKGLTYDGRTNISGVPLRTEITESSEHEGYLVWSVQSEGEGLEIETIGYTICYTNCDTNLDNVLGFSRNSNYLDHLPTNTEEKTPLQHHSSVSFNDITNTVHQININKLAELGIVRGCNPPQNSYYCPNRLINRGEIAALLSRTLELSPTERDYFTDDGDNSHHDSINMITQIGLTTGCNPPNNNEYCPERSLTRGELATLLVRAYDLDKGPVLFEDVENSVHRNNIASLHQAGIVRGCNPPNNNRFCPGKAVTRAEAATFLMNAIAYQNKGLTS